jgi:hypothetical protein
MSIWDWGPIDTVLDATGIDPSKAEKEHQQNLKDAQAQYEAMKGPYQQALMNSLKTRTQMLEPQNVLLAKMGGQPIDYRKVLQNPWPQYSGMKPTVY